MNKFFVIFSLLVALAVSDLTAEEAGEKFLKSLIKHLKYKDSGIFTEDFHMQGRTAKLSREKSIAYLFETVETGVFGRTGEWQNNICSFIDDGHELSKYFVLKIKFFKNNRYGAYLIAKPNRYIEGGYKLDKIVFA